MIDQGLVQKYIGVARTLQVKYCMGESPEPDSIHDYLGTEDANGEPSNSIDLRLKRCYELAGCCVLSGKAPQGSSVVHGSWHGPGAPQRIGHAWVRLPLGLIWEPIRGNVFLEREFYEWTRAWDEREYAFNALATMVMSHNDFGRWHESRYP